MRPRLPSLDWFSVVCGGFVAGVVVTVSTPTVAAAGEVGLPILAGLATWTLLEQVPDSVDRLLLGRAHWLGGGLAVAFAGVAILGRAGWITVPNSLTIPLLAVAMLAVFVLGAGGKRRARVLRRESTVRLTLQAEKSRQYALATTGVALLGTVGLVSPLFGDPILPSLLGTSLGVAVAWVFTWTPSVELTATDSALFVADRPSGDAEAIRWGRVRAISTEGATVRIRRGLPSPMVYRATFESPDEATTRADTLRRCRRAVE